MLIENASIGKQRVKCCHKNKEYLRTLVTFRPVVTSPEALTVGSNIR